MHRISELACAFAMCSFALSATVFAQTPQQQCAPRGEVVKVLNAKYQESQRALGLINEKAMMEVYISPAGTWTMVVTNEAGIACVLAAGEAWDEMPAKAIGPAS
jgi:hypothetical protein